MEKKNGNRPSCRFSVRIRGDGADRFFPCKTEDLGIEGARVQGLPHHTPGTTFTLQLDKGFQHHRLDAVLTYWQPHGAGLKFVNTTREQRQFLKTISNARWNGEDLLEGVLMTAPCMQLDGLKDWLSLTTLLSKRHRRLKAPPIED